MGIHETFSKRLEKRERVGQPDVYQYDELPQPLRVQINHIWNSTIGSTYYKSYYYTDASHQVYDYFKRTLCREMGVFSLTNDADDPAEEQCKHLLLNGSTLNTLDIIELSFRIIPGLGNIYEWDQHPPGRQSSEEAIKELNFRFKEHGVGYQFEGGEVVRVDSQYVHAEVVKPAISLLNTVGFDGASEEFLRAHEHYRKGRLGEGMSDALKAFESTMKAICDKNGWAYPATATAKTLVNVVLDNNLVPRYMETHLAGLRNTLEAGLPTVRNKNSGHGQGAQVREVPEYFAGYALHLAATNIVFLVEAQGALNGE